MANIIVAFHKVEDGKSIKNILSKNGFQVIAVCTTGAQTLNYADSLSNGIIVSGYRFSDMIYAELHDCLPPNFEMLLVASSNYWADSDVKNIVCLSMPIKMFDLIQTLEMMCQTQIRQRKKQRQLPKNRNDEEVALIDKAKTILMERNNLSEGDAHKYIQKCSMDNGTNMVETAQMIISLITI